MDENELWQVMIGQREQVCALLESLGDADWAVPSLCAGWTVRDVVAHLTLQQVTPAQGMAMLLRSPGGLAHVTAQAARRRAGWPVDRLVADFRSTMGRRRKNAGIPLRSAVIDMTVHALDITVPLGRPPAVDPTAAIVAADRIWVTGYPWHARKRLPGRRFIATDVPWSAGDGELVQGPIAELLLLLTGRPSSLSPV